MFTYMKMKKDFIKDFEEESIVEWLSDERENTGFSELASWRNSIPYLYAALKDDRISDNVLVGLEYTIDSEFYHRVDVMIGGYDKNGKSTIVVAEMKQWSDLEYEAADNKLMNSFYRSLVEEKNPSMQVLDYCYEMAGNNRNASKLNFVPIVYLHNQLKNHCDSRVEELLLDNRDNALKQFIECIDRQISINGTDPYLIRYKDHLENIYNNGSERSKFLRCGKRLKHQVFWAGQIRQLSGFLADQLSGTDKEVLSNKGKNETFSILRKGLKINNFTLYKKVDDILNGSTKPTLRKDQRRCYDGINEKIEDFLNNRSADKFVFVEGGPGSGKTILALMLMEEYQNRAGMEIGLFAPNGSVVKAYNYNNNENINYFPNNIGDFVDCFRKRSENDPPKIIILDELHRVRNKLFCQVRDYIEQNDHLMLIAFYDSKQRVIKQDFDTNSISSDYQLRTQFRCSRDEGYVTWLERTLNMYGDVPENHNYSFKRNHLDFEVEFVKDNKELKELIDNKNNVIVTAPSYKNGETDRIKVGTLILSKWDKKNPETFIKHHYDDNSKINYIGDVYAIQGVETDSIVVIIGDELKYKKNRSEHVYLDLDRRDDLEIIKRLGFSQTNFDNNPDDIRTVIMNAYRILLTRGMKKCYIYCCNKKLREYMENS